MVDYTFDMVVALRDQLISSGGLEVEVYNGAVPRGATMPYVTVSSIDTNSVDALTALRNEAHVTLTVWSQQKGRTEVSGLVAQIKSLLHRKRLTMSSGRWVRSYVIRGMTRPDIDEETFMGSVTVRILYEEE